MSDRIAVCPAPSSDGQVTPAACAHGLITGVGTCRSRSCRPLRNRSHIEVDVVGRPMVLLWKGLTTDEVDIARAYAADHGLHIDLCNTPTGASIDARLTIR